MSAFATFRKCGILVLAATLFGVGSPVAANERVIWRATQSDVSCILWRISNPDTALTFGIEVNRTSGRARVIMSTNGFGVPTGMGEPTILRLDPAGPEASGLLVTERSARGNDYFVAGEVDSGFVASIASSASMEVQRSGELLGRWQLPDSKNALGMLQRCLEGRAGNRTVTGEIRGQN